MPRRDKWNLQEFGIAGILKHAGQAKIVDSEIGTNIQFGKCVIKIRGDSEKFEFEPNDKKNSTLTRIEFWARRNSPTMSPISLQCKSTKRSEHWEDITNLTDKIDDQSYSKIEITAEDLSKVDKSQKFRLKLGGERQNEILLDHLTIELN